MRGGHLARSLLIAVSVVAVALAAPAVAGGVSGQTHARAADRSQLREIIAGARVDNQASAASLTRLPAGDARLVRDQLNRLRDSAGALSAELSKAPAPVSKSLAERITRLGRQAGNLRAGSAAAEAGLAVLGEVRSSALAELRRGLEDGFAPSFGARQYRWSAAGAHALADLTAARASIGSLTPLAREPSARRALDEARRGRVPVAVAGWIPIPGGCALPPGQVAQYLPPAGAQAPLLWTSPSGLSDHRDQLRNPTPALAAAYAKTMRQAESLAAEAGSAQDNAVVTKRVLAVGYAWLVTSQPEYREALVADARMLSVATAQEPVDEAKEALVLATILDWLAVPGMPVMPAADEAVLEAARQVLAIRMLGSLGCSLALGENIAVDKLNKSVIIGSASVMGAIASASDQTWRTGMAALVRAALLGAKSGLEVLDVDGGSPEGPVYWNFQTVPAAGLLSSIDASLPDRTVKAVPSLARAGRYAWQMAAPSSAGNWETTRYSDTRDTVLRSTLPAWIAGRYGDPDAIAVALQGQLRQGVELLWWPREEVEAPLGDAVFPRSGVAVLRAGRATAWLLGQPEITNHTQLDAGGVTVRVDGVDWSLDAGYGIEGPGYSEEKPTGRRWTYPQTQPSWHSTLRTFRSKTDLGQVVGATAALSLTTGSARVDLRGVLAGTTQAKRTLSLTDSALTISDSIRGRRQGYAWAWITHADVAIQGDTARLTMGERTATLEFEALPRGSTITTSKAPAALGMSGTRIQVQIPATEQLDLVARLRWGP